MKLELVQELKELGYPQETEKNWYFVDGEVWAEVPEGYYEACEYTDWIAAPSLEELIEELGDKFERLLRYDDRLEGLFQAWTTTEETAKLPKGKWRGWGNTPTEAVAKLWIELRKGGCI